MQIKGVCHALFAYDVGFAIHLEQMQKNITEAQRRDTFRHRRRAPQVELHRKPLRINQSGGCIEVGKFETAGNVEMVIYDFGVICVSYYIGLKSELEGLVELSHDLYDHEGLMQDSRERVRKMMDEAGGAIEKPMLRDLVEDYMIFEVHREPGASVEEFIGANRGTLARILRAEREMLSGQEVLEAIEHTCAYGKSDSAIIDWFAAVLLGDEMHDERAVLEYGVAELLALRVLDHQLDVDVDAAYDALAKPQGWRRTFAKGSGGLARVSRIQVDNAMLFEGVNNAWKLLGDQYLARLYSSIQDRFHLSEWDATIERKLQTLDSIYQKLADRASNRRLEVLEWIIIILIAYSIWVPYE